MSETTDPPEDLEAPSEEPPQQQPEGADEQPQRRLLESLYRRGSEAKMVVRSHDPEIGIRPRKVRGEWGQTEEVVYQPEILGRQPERKEMWALMRKPVTDTEQIALRQRTTQTFIDAPNRVEIIKAKNKAYKITDGINGIFQTVALDERGDVKMPMIIAYRGHGKTEYEDHIKGYIATLEEGKKGLAELKDEVSKIDGPIAQKMQEDLDTAIDAVAVLDAHFFLEGEIKNLYGAQSRAEAAVNTVHQYGVFVEFAELIDAEKWAQVSFDPEQPIGYEEAWSITMPKEEQVANDCPADAETNIFCGSNMSGKSFNGLKVPFYLQLAAQSIGYAPAKKMNARMHDSIAYLDRASTEHQNNLSAFGSEIADINAFIDEVGENARVFIDEGLSTTDKEGQYYLLSALGIYLRAIGARTNMANHNEEFIRSASDQEGVAIHHLQIDPEAEEKKDFYKYRFQDGIEGSNALQIGATLGLDAGFISRAEAYARGEARPTTQPHAKWNGLPAPETVEELMAQQRDYILARPVPPEDWEVYPADMLPGAHFDNFDGWSSSGRYRHGGLALQLFSDDEDFARSGRFSNPAYQTPYESSDFKVGSWRPVVGSEGNAFRHLVQDCGPVSPESLASRRAMFEDLANLDPYDALHAVQENLAIHDRFDYFLESRSSDLLAWNKVMCPFSDRDGHDGRLDENLELLESYHNFLNEIHGGDLPQEWMAVWNKIQYLKMQLDDVEARVMAMTPEQIKANIDEEMDREILDPVIIRSFQEIAIDERPPGRYEEKLTARRIKAYLKWLERNDHSKHWDLRRGDGPAFMKYSYEAPSSVDRETKRMKAAFAEHCPDLDFDSLTLNEIHAAVQASEVYELGEEFNRWARDLDKITIYRGAQGLREDTLKSDIRAALRGVSDIVGRMDPISAFDCDIDSALPHLQPIIDAQIEDHKNSDLDYMSGSWNQYPALQLSLGFRNYLDDDPIDKVLQALEGADSPLVQGIIEFWKKRRDEGECQAQLLYGKMEAVYHTQFKEVRADADAILAKVEAISTKYPGARRSERMYYIKKILKAKRSRPHTHEKRIDAMRDMGFYCGDSFEWIKKYSDRAREVNEAQAFDEIMAEACGEGRLEEWEDIEGVYREFAADVERFCERHDRKFSYRSNSAEEFRDQLESGETSRFEDIVKWEFMGLINKKMNRKKRTHYEKEIKIRKEMQALVTLAWVARLIKEGKLTKVEFVEEGEVELRGVKSMFLADAKGHNDLVLSKEAQAHLMTGPNMSGKTVVEKDDVQALACALAIGYAPCESAKMPHLDGVVYMDRVNSKRDRDLSAFGNEVEYWKKIIELMRSGKKYVFVVDEGFSTTSSSFQEALSYAAVQEAIATGQFIMFATHNHDLVDGVLAQLPGTKAYHLDYTVSDEGVDFSYNLTEGHKPSEAVAVAKTLGLRAEILDLIPLVPKMETKHAA